MLCCSSQSIAVDCALPEAGMESEQAQDTEVIFCNPRFRIANEANMMVFKVSQATKKVCNFACIGVGI